MVFRCYLIMWTFYMKAQSIFPSFNVLKNDYMTRVGQTRIELQVGGAERSGTALYPFANEPMMHKRGKPMQDQFPVSLRV